jgi:hypothetical protein
MNMRVRQISIALLSFALVVCGQLPIFAKAAGLEVAPARLNISVGSAPVTARLEVKNPTADVQLFEASLDEVEPGVTVRPKSFTLQSGQAQIVQVVAEPSSSRSFSGTVSIVGRPLKDSSVSAVGGGVKVPVTVHFGASQSWYDSWTFWAKVLGVLAFTMLAYYFARRKKI